MLSKYITKKDNPNELNTFGKGLNLYNKIQTFGTSEDFQSGLDEKAKAQEYTNLLDKEIADTMNSQYQEMFVTPQSIDAYEKSLEQYNKMRLLQDSGLTPEEIAFAQNQYTQSANLNYQNAIQQSGGQFAPYINSALNTGANKFALGLSAQDQEIKRQNRALALSYLQNLQNSANVFQDVAGQNFQKQILVEQALGQAKQNDIANQQAIKAQELKNNAATKSAMTTSLTSLLASDIRLKENILYSHTENGYKIYEFNYIDKPNVRYSGVIAQEVLKINPEAVVETKDGYLAVQYDKIGLTMKKI